MPSLAGPTQGWIQRLGPGEEQTWGHADLEMKGGGSEGWWGE